MELDYRTVLHLGGRGGRTVTEEFNSAIYDWLRKKKLDASRIAPGIHEYSPTTVGSLTHIVRQDQSEISGFRLTEVRDTGGGEHETWNTDVVAYQGRDGTGDLLIHVHDPRANTPGNRPGPTGVPGIVRLLTEATLATDGLMVMQDQPRILDVDDEDLVHDMIVDAERRNLLILAATPSGKSPDSFATQVSGITGGTVGQAGTFVLTSQLVDLLNPHLSYLFLPRGGLRMIPPDTDPGDRASVSGAYYVTAERIAERDPKRVYRHWTWLAREAGNSAPWPKHLVRILRELSAHEQATRASEIEELIARRLPSPASLITSTIEPAVIDADTVQVDLQTRASNTEILEVEAAGDSQATVRADEVLADALRSAFPSSDIIGRILAFGGGLDLTESLDFALLLAGDYDTLADKVKSLTLDTSAADRSITDLDAIESLQAQLHNSLTELEELEGRLDREQRSAAWLREQLISAGKANLAWAHDHTDVELAQDFDTVLEQLLELSFVIFTGEPEQALDLNDMKGSIAAAKNTHRALLSLNDYARAKSEGVWSGGGFHDYVSDPPPGFWSYGRKNVAMKESESVANHSKFRRHRELPMPDGPLVYMEAHIKLSTEAMTSPSLHFFDDSGRSGHMIVGYIGAHLPNNQS